MIDVIAMIVFPINLVVLIFALPIALSEEVYYIEQCLTDKREFIRCLVQWQCLIFKWTRDRVKKSGVLFLIVLASIFIWPSNTIVFFVLIACEIARLFVFVFMKVFGKKET